MTSNLHCTKVNLPLVRIKGKAGKLAKNAHSGTKREIMRLWCDTMTREHEEKGRHWRQNSVQFSSVTQSCPTLCDPRNRSMPGLPVHHQLLEFTETSIESVMPSSHLILCRPLLLLPPIPSSIRVFSNESTLRMRWPKYWQDHNSQWYFAYRWWPSERRRFCNLLVSSTLRWIFNKSLLKRLFREHYPYGKYVVNIEYQQWWDSVTK